MAKNVVPNLWVLAGDGIHVRYSTIPWLGPAGGAHLLYQDGSRSLNFSADQIRLVDVADLGTIASVTLHLTIDVGSTSFSILYALHEPRAFGERRADAYRRA